MALEVPKLAILFLVQSLQEGMLLQQLLPVVLQQYNPMPSNCFSTSSPEYPNKAFPMQAFPLWPLQRKEAKLTERLRHHCNYMTQDLEPWKQTKGLFKLWASRGQAKV